MSNASPRGDDPPSPPRHGASSARSTDSGLLELLTLERIEDNLFRTAVLSSAPAGLYGGQVAAQALRAGAQTVPAGRHPHSCHACALTYISDMFSGLSGIPGVAHRGALTSIDHAVWFYRQVPLDDWVLMDLQPESAAGGRGMYTGRIFGRDGTLAAGIAQESLFRVPGSTAGGPAPGDPGPPTLD